jgi:hypothetical protein
VLNATLLMSGLILHEMDRGDQHAARESARELERYVRLETDRIVRALDADRDRRAKEFAETAPQSPAPSRIAV